MHSYCLEESDGSTSCVCEEGFENDPSDQDSVSENLCRRIDPCNNYSCDIQNSACAINGDSPQCVCDNNYTPYLDDGSGTSSLYTESVFFESGNSLITCAPSLPCTMTPCDAEENKICSEEDIDGIPTAFCSCSTGYGDINDSDNKILAADSSNLLCENIDECV